MKNLKFLIAIAALIITANLNAQTEKQTPAKVPDMLQNADYVFEGTVVDSKGYWVKDERGINTIYTSLLVEVTNVFKGNGMKLGFVQVIVKGGEAPSLDDDEITISTVKPSHGNHPPVFTQKGNRGIVFGKNVSNSKGCVWDKKMENTMVIEHDRAIIYCQDCWDNKYFAPWAGDFGNAKELRKSIKSFNLQTDFIDRTDIVEDSLQQIQLKKEKAEQEAKDAELQKIKIETQKREALFIKGKELAKAEQEAKKANPNLKLASGGNLNLDIRNIAYSTAAGVNYLDFDIYVWGTQATYFEGTLVRLNFDKAAFGDSLYVKNYLTATKGTSFNNINYKIYGPGYISDTVVGINLSTNDSLYVPTRIAVGTTPLQLMHIKFRIKNCQATAKMKFVDPVICDILTGYKLHSNDSIAGPIQSYDNVFRTDNSPIALCPIPKITGFSPSVIRAGTNEVLTITGTNFGTTRGKGQVLFPDADSFSRYMQGCDTLDYVSWNDSEIKVKVPSTIVNSNFTKDVTAGSGKFKVVNDIGFRDSTTTNLDVEFGIENSSTKKKVVWAFRNCQNSSFIFKLGNSLQPYPQAIAVIDSAINVWARFLRIDLRLQKDDYNNYQYFADGSINNLDTISMLYIDNTLANGTLMETTSCVATCGGIPRRQASDIGIKMTGIIWHYGINDTKPSGKYDFYSDILHELGHALGLMHIINPNATTNSMHELELMFWNETLNISKTPAQRSYIGTGRQMDKKASLYIRDTSKVMPSCSFLKPIREFSSPQSKVACVGSSVSFTAYCEQLSGSPAPTYQWEVYNISSWVNVTPIVLGTSVSGTTTGTMTIPTTVAGLNGKSFRCKISNVDGCTLYTQVAVLTFNTPSFYANPTNGTVNEHGSFNFPAQSTDSTLQYKWQQKLAGSSVYNDINNGGYFSGTTTQVLSITNTPYSFDQSYFRCKGTNTAGCIGYSAAAKLTVNPTGFAPGSPNQGNSTAKSALKATVYPNPGSNAITINLNDAKNIQSISIFKSNGTEVFKNAFSANSATIDISNLSNGLYLIKISDGNNTVTKEIVITH